MNECLARIPRGIFVVLAILHAGFLSVLSHFPGDDLPSGGFWWSFAFNLAHAPLHGGLAFLVALAALDRSGERPRLTPRAVAVTLVVVLAFAWIDEWHQSHVALRSSDPRDVVTDACGHLAALAFLNALLVPPGARARWILISAVAVIASLLAAMVATTSR
jgi:VanZ family protein